MEVKVTKLTGIDLLRRANSVTSGRESRATLAAAYRSGHSTIRTQIFFVECRGIPQFVSYHFRTHFTIHPMPPYEYGWMLSKRTDRGGGDFTTDCAAIADSLCTAADTIDDPDGMSSLMRDVVQSSIRHAANAVLDLPTYYDRLAPTDFSFTVSAEGLMSMAHKRLCMMASKETREVMTLICEGVRGTDPDLYPHLVPQCVFRGVCPERTCGFVRTERFREIRNHYKSLFNQ